MTHGRSRALELGAFLLCTLIWGSTWLGIKLGHAEHMPPFTAAALRFGVASIVLVALQLVTRTRLPRGRREWALCGFMGLLQMGIDYALIYWAETKLSSGLTSVLFAVAPLLTACMAAAAGLERLSIRKILGIAGSIAGVAAIFREQIGASDADLLAMLAVIGGAACSAATSVAAKKIGASVPPLTLNMVGSIVGAGVLFSIAFAAGEDIRLPSTGRAWVFVLYLGIVGSVVAFLVYFWLLRRWSATATGLISVFTPVMALALGTAFNDEPLGALRLVGSALVLVGVFVAMRPARAATPPSPSNTTAR